MTNENKTDGAQLVVSQTPTTPSTISINVGFPGNIRKIVLEGNRQWTVADALHAAEFDASGYEIRMGGEPVQLNAFVTDGRTILLLRPVRGN
jgi:sulfur carrier protein ThiS